MFEPSLELNELGFSPFFMQQLEALPPGACLGRIVCERRGQYIVVGAVGAERASLAGRLVHELPEDDWPTVGDWVVLQAAQPVGRIVRVLERQNVLRRVAVGGSSRAQNLAANVDTCCVVAALSAGDAHAQQHALNPRRIERYLVTAERCQIRALVLVNKADVVTAEAALLARDELIRALPRACVLLVSARSGEGLDQLRAELPPTSSAVVLGSSGVGKSTLVNALLGGELLRTSPEREADARGRHTTTERQLVKLAHGALLIDTPGMRELALWADAEADLSESAPDVQNLAAACRFRDCRHQGEPGCAVAGAIEAGQLPRERLEHARELERELAHQQSRVDVRLREARQKRSKQLVIAARARLKEKAR
jgi:ribosome biogenesis GTPase